MSSRTTVYRKRGRRRLRIAMIGPASSPETGTSILFRILLDGMPACGVAVECIPIPVDSPGALAKVRKSLAVIAKTIHVARHVDIISVHVPTLQVANIAFAALIVARAFQRIFVLRKFGGTDLSDLHRPARWLAEQVMKRSDLSFVEAKGQCEALRRRLSTGVFWYPNYRRPRDPWSGRNRTAGRFIYLGRVRDEKGIREMVEAAGSLDGRCSVDVYGPYDRGFDRDVIGRSPCVHYRGVLSHADIPSILPEYDALLLPTYWNGEGYPGVIVEAFQAGVPVIATRWKFIPEIVDETCGILVEPGSVRELGRAMDRLVSDEELVRRLRRGALSKARSLSADRWIEFFAQACLVAFENSGDRAEMRRQVSALYAQSQSDVPGPETSHGDSDSAECESVRSGVW